MVVLGGGAVFYERGTPVESGARPNMQHPFEPANTLCLKVACTEFR